MIRRAHHRLLTRGPIDAARAVLVGALAAAAGCLSVPPGPEPMCHSTNDCDRSHGEVCEDGVCWGNPPAGPFAAVVSPPSARRDLVPRELPQLTIPDFGWMGDLALEAPVLLSGKLVAFCPPPTACDPTPLAGTITVSRPSQFHGGPGFKTVATVATGDSFSIPVRRTQPDDDDYTVTIAPDSTPPATGASAAQLVPPRRMQVAVTDNTNTQAVELGGADLPVISGTLVDSSGNGIANYRVSALGHWDPTEAPTEISTIDFTDVNGAYAITLSDQLVGTVELIARPVAVTPTAPAPVAATVHVTNIDATKSSLRPAIMLPANLGAPVPLMLNVSGLDPSGALSFATGARVTVAGALVTGPTSFTISDTEVADTKGNVGLMLLDGSAFSGSYQMSITPPAGANLAAVFEQPATLDMAPGIRLGARVALSGTVIGPDGKPLGNATVTARPSLRFLWTLDAASQAFAAAIPAATKVTPPDGSFALFVDPNIDGIWGNYDIEIDPADGAGAATFVLADYPIPRGSTSSTVNIDAIHMTGPAYVHGRVTGPDGQSVSDAELKLYKVSTQLTLCSQVQHAPSTCPIPAQLEARNTSGDDGTVSLVLPRP